MGFSVDGGRGDQNVIEETVEHQKIIPQELRFLKKIGLPVSKISSKRRHEKRMQLRNQWLLYDRQCDKCGTEITTSYAMERPEPVYCEGCYLGEAK